MERKAEMNNKVVSIHDLTEEELLLLAALRNPGKMERLWEVMKGCYCDRSQSRHGG